MFYIISTIFWSDQETITLTLLTLLLNMTPCSDLNYTFEKEKFDIQPLKILKVLNTCNPHLILPRTYRKDA